MSLHLRYTLPASAGLALVGLAAYAVYKSGGLRPALVGALRGGVKAADWAGKKLACAKENVAEMVAEAKAPKAKPAPKAAAKPAAAKAAPKAAKPAVKPAAKATPKAPAPATVPA